MINTQKLPTKSPLDKLLDGGIEKDTITNIYGEPGSGKTNIAMLCTISCIEQEKKALFIDTEGGFSFDRFKQLTKENFPEYIKNIIFIMPKTWEEQIKCIENLEKILEQEDVGLIIIDSIVSLYRLEISEENFQKVNRELSRQYAILSNISRSRNIPTLVTNQVYSVSGKIELTSRLIGKYWSKALIKLEKLDSPNHRLATIIKHRSLPEGEKIEFEITKDGLKEVRKISIF
ncbi:MAG: DNA repair and recombination protein RadB [Candidatus Aenigmatarchaeota archaeon]|nr:DNA repair and recombination protein RadB [Candidatus Aenigmarchaeota archaeon]